MRLTAIRSASEARLFSPTVIEWPPSGWRSIWGLRARISGVLCDLRFSGSSEEKPAGCLSWAGHCGAVRERASGHRTRREPPPREAEPGPSDAPKRRGLCASAGGESCCPRRVLFGRSTSAAPEADAPPDSGDQEPEARIGNPSTNSQSSIPNSQFQDPIKVPSLSSA